MISKAEVYEQCLISAADRCPYYKKRQGSREHSCNLKPIETKLQCVMVHQKACNVFELLFLPTMGKQFSKDYTDRTYIKKETFKLCEQCGKRLINPGKGRAKVCEECKSKVDAQDIVQETHSPSVDEARPPLQSVEVFTDGACSGNPGPGGWGAFIKCNGEERELSGGEAFTTNNKMELTAAIEALKSLPGCCQVTLSTDSEYVKKGITEWIEKWKKNGWRTSGRDPVKNADLWRALDELNQKHQIEWKWVKGHSGHPENERCDELATQAIKEL